MDLMRHLEESFDFERDQSPNYDDTILTEEKATNYTKKMVKFISAEDRLGEDANCCICLEKNTTDTEPVFLPCCEYKQAVCKECIKNLFMMKGPECPSCRGNIIDAVNIFIGKSKQERNRLLPRKVNRNNSHHNNQEIQEPITQNRRNKKSRKPKSNRNQDNNDIVHDRTHSINFQNNMEDILNKFKQTIENIPRYDNNFRLRNEPINNYGNNNYENNNYGNNNYNNRSSRNVFEFIRKLNSIGYICRSTGDNDGMIEIYIQNTNYHPFLISNYIIENEDLNELCGIFSSILNKLDSIRCSYEKREYIYQTQQRIESLNNDTYNNYNNNCECQFEMPRGRRDNSYNPMMFGNNIPSRHISEIYNFL